MSDAPSLPVSRLREAAQRAVDASSLRAVAEAVGISHPGLMKFLDGSEPHPATLTKLMRWYLRASAVPLDEETALAAIELLVRSVPEPERERVRAGLLDVLREGHRKRGNDPPPWLADC